jgi:nicotinamidase-related amidase
MPRILPFVERVALRHPERNIFTRFIPPAHPKQAPGAWRRFYERWRDIVCDRLDPRLLDLVPSLAAIAPYGTIIDKRVYSPFGNPHLSELLLHRQIETLIVTGVETDVCVLGAVLRAVDEGYRVVIVRDAIGSSLDATHDALLMVYSNRLSEQIEVADSEMVASCWL